MHVLQHDSGYLDTKSEMRAVIFMNFAVLFPNPRDFISFQASNPATLLLFLSPG